MDAVNPFGEFGSSSAHAGSARAHAASRHPAVHLASSKTLRANALSGAHSPASSGAYAWTLAATRTRHANARSRSPSSTRPLAFFLSTRGFSATDGGCTRPAFSCRAASRGSWGRLLMSEDVDDDAVDRIETDRLCCETANGGVAGVAGVAGNDGLFDADFFVEDAVGESSIGLSSIGLSSVGLSSPPTPRSECFVGWGVW
mmetsp:Transcript_5272/g.23710  ORF Transcript_5272/g.23710 Transcript_5272/m.23710 type:complete len:201 (-) Transcript_5272:2627-3229(-)